MKVYITRCDPSSYLLNKMDDDVESVNAKCPLHRFSFFDLLEERTAREWSSSDEDTFKNDNLSFRYFIGWNYLGKYVGEFLQFKK
ncbi:hypothetical protein V1477_010952 [Vespula maculifrons]|uniref:Uncharacterized protein n=1 Tax=Vespula maculifrons TaxID=7453 RepID=A0ABD2C5A0_VESMC